MSPATYVHMWHDSYEWVMSYMSESCHIWVSHVTYERDMSRMNGTCHIPRRMSESCHIWMSKVIYECVMFHMSESWRIPRQKTHQYALVIAVHKWAMSHINTLCHTCAWGMSRMKTSDLNGNATYEIWILQMWYDFFLYDSFLYGTHKGRGEFFWRGICHVWTRQIWMGMPYMSESCRIWMRHFICICVKDFMCMWVRLFMCIWVRYFMYIWVRHFICISVRHFTCERVVTHTGWRRLIGSLICIGHFLQKWPVFSGSFVENDLQLRGSYESSPPCTSARQGVSGDSYSCDGRIWMSHITYERVMSRMKESRHIGMSHVMYEWVVSHMSETWDKPLQKVHHCSCDCRPHSSLPAHVIPSSPRSSIYYVQSLH